MQSSESDERLNKKESETHVGGIISPLSCSVLKAARVWSMIMHYLLLDDLKCMYTAL